MLPESVDCQALIDQLKEGVCAVDSTGTIVLWNRGAEEITGYAKREALLGASAGGIVVCVDSGGRPLPPAEQPLAKALGKGEPLEADVVVRHKRGHRVPVAMRASALRDGAGAVVGGLVVLRDNAGKRSLVKRIAELERLALIDPLTGLANRRQCLNHLKVCLDEWYRYGWPFGVLMMDIDRFKPVNDTHGHAAGDEALKTVARALEKNLRSFDMVGRWGGEEFVVVALNVDAYYIQALAERLRRLVKKLVVTTETGQAISLTISVGATLPRSGDTVDSLVERADAMLYRSKAQGRDRVSFVE